MKSNRLVIPRFILLATVLSSAFLATAQNPTAPYGVPSPTSVNFGPVLLNQTSPQLRVSLKNTGESQMTISSISISGNFAIPVNHCGAGVRPNTHCDVYVTFTPQDSGTENGTLTFVDNASNTPQTVPLTGIGATVVPTKTTVTASPKAVNAGQSITFTATVVSLGGGAVPNGDQVSFNSSGCQGSGTLQNGVAVVTIPCVVYGKENEEGQTMIAQYIGDQTFEPSKGRTDITVTKWPVSVTASSSSNPSIVGQPFTMTANITAQGPFAPTGTICFGYQTHCVGISNGSASSSFPAQADAGNLLVPVIYDGSPYDASSEGSYTQVVNASPTTTSIKSSKNPSAQGQPVKLSVLVTAPYAHEIPGSITFVSGVITLGTVQLSDSRGSITVSSLPAGQNTITVTYTPSDTNFVGSSASIVQTVE
jgi:hypothetical protein